jgi:hypothetical protein
VVSYTSSLSIEQTAQWTYWMLFVVIITRSRVVQLSLNPLFRRGHSALFKAIGESLCPETSDELDLSDNPLPEGEEFRILNLIAQVVPMPKEHPFFLLGMDCTSRERAFAQTLKDRGMVHQSTTII